MEWEKLKHATAWVTTTTTNIFSSDVPNRKIRYILKIIITGDQVTSRVLDLYKVKRDNTTEDFIKNINVAAPAYIEIPQGEYDPRKPILVLEGGTNLAGKVSGNSVSVTVIYYDDVL